MVADFAGAKYGVAAVNGTAALHFPPAEQAWAQDYVILPNLTLLLPPIQSNTWALNPADRCRPASLADGPGSARRIPGH